MYRLKLIIPLIFFIFSLSWLAFILSLEPIVMAGDDFGYDPGGKVIPVASSIIMAIASLWQLIINRHTDYKEDSSRGSGGLIFINIAVSILLISTFRYAGFILSAGIALHILILFNLWTEDRTYNLLKGFAWLSVTIIYLITMYSLLRTVIKLCFGVARRYELPVFREPALQAGLGAFVLTVSIFLIGSLFSRFFQPSKTRSLIQVVTGTILGIYIIFRMLFLVQLPAGLLSW